MALTYSNFSCLRSSVNEEDVKDEEIGEYNGCEVKRSRELGRYIVATKPIKKDELIVKDEALILAPIFCEKPVCLGCMKQIDRVTPKYRCRRCYWQLCGPHCKGMHTKLGHSKWECELFGAKRIGRIVEKWKSDDRHLAYDALCVIRCLLLKLFDKDRWKKLSSLESNNVTRAKNESFLHEMKLIECIRVRWDIDLFTAEEIYTTIGIIWTNAFLIKSNFSLGRGIFYLPSFFEHSCSPNATYSQSEEKQSSTLKNLLNLEVHANRDIVVGESVTVFYGPRGETTLQRRFHLYGSKYFWCSCSKCADPTELGTYGSALYCASCSIGPVLPEDPLDCNSDWRCRHCSKRFGAERVIKNIYRLQKILNAINTDDAQGYEEFLEKYRHILDGRHYFMRQAKQALKDLGHETE